MRLTSPRLIAIALVAMLFAGLAPAALAAPATPAARELTRLPGPQVSKTDPVAERDADTVLVKFDAGASETSEDAALDRSGAEEIGTAGATGYEVAELDPGITPEEAVRDLESERIVDDAQVNFVRQTSALPNDLETDQDYLKTLRLPAAWNLTKGTSTKTIAFLDTGIDTDHPDLASRIKPGYNAITGTSNVVDDNGHGTFVAGVAAGISNNDRGIVGSAWAAGIMPVKVLNADGEGTDADIAEGITWAANHGASVINLSLGGPGFSKVLNDAINYAFSKNIIVVAAAGNEGSAVPSYPAALGGVIAVTATDSDVGSTFAYFSNHGWWVDVAAPGMNIVSTMAGPGEQYAIGDGTSFAAPLVSGIAFLMRLRYPTMPVGTVGHRIRITSQDHGPYGFDPSYGAGRVDAYAALGGARFGPRGPITAAGAEPNDSFDRAAPLVATASSAIAPEGDADWWATDVATRGFMTATLTPPAFQADPPRAKEMDPVLEIFSPDGSRTGFADAGWYGQAETLTVATVVPGAYRIRVTNYFGSRTPSNYTLSVSTTEHSGPYFGAALTRRYDTLPASHVAVADVTDDGRNDVITEVDTSLVVFPQSAEGTISGSAGATTYPASVGNVIPAAGTLAVGDLNGDDRTDVVLSPGSGLDLFEQIDGGGFAPVTHVGTLSSSRSTVIADHDGDGANEIFFATLSGIGMLTKTPAGWVEVPVANDASDEIEVADVTGDSKLDVISLSAQSVKVYRQNAIGTWDPAASYAIPDAGISTATGLEIVDTNHDSRLDVLTAGPGELKLFLQNAFGTLNAAADHATGGHSLDAADVDGDGVVDVAVADGSSTLLYPGLAAGLGTAWTPYAAGSAVGPDTLVLADISGDGLMDVVTATGLNGITLRTQFAPAPGIKNWVSDQSPPDFATLVALDVHPTLKFHRELDPSTITDQTVALVHGTTLKPVPSTLGYDSVSRTITITPTSLLLPDTSYLVAAWLVEDLGDALMTEVHVHRFRTVP